MTYQKALFSDQVMQDRRCGSKGPPETYGTCRPRRHLRSLPPENPLAERCQHFSCPYNLTAELALRRNQCAAVRAMAARYEAGVWDTCALDVAADEPDDETIGLMMGIESSRVAQVFANAHFKAKRAGEQHLKHLEMLEAMRLKRLKM